LPLIAGLRLAALPCCGLLAAETLTRTVPFVQPLAAPAQVLRTKTSSTAFVSLATKFVARDANVTICPFVLTRGCSLLSPPGVVPSGVETRIVEVVQPVAPVQASRRKTCCTPLVTPETRFVAVEPKAMKRPSELSDDCKLGPFAALDPSSGTVISVVEGVQPLAPPWQVARRNICCVPEVTLETRFVAVEENETNAPLLATAGCELGPFAALDPSSGTVISVVEGVQVLGCPLHVSRKKI
jgi:hypothetical protein